MTAKWKETYSFGEFMEIIRYLRSEKGCPWDREQTHESLRTCMIEEAYESIEAIENQDLENLCEELGDILLQVALHTAIAEEKREFTIEDVLKGISRKMIRRHPHVFVQANKEAGYLLDESTDKVDSKEVIKNWEEIKSKEKDVKKASEEVLGVPKAFPALIRAEKVQKKAAKTGFDFPDYEEALKKVYEELSELEKARANTDKDSIYEEYGDLLFSVVNLSRFLVLNAENSLTNATNKFINRFVGIEQLAEAKGKCLNELSISELEALWGRMK